MTNVAKSSIAQAALIHSRSIPLTPFDGEPKWEPFVQRTVQVAEENVRAGGRPFATIIVETESGRIVAEAGNEVAQVSSVFRSTK